MIFRNLLQPLPLFVCLIVLLFADSTQAATFNVTNINDSGSGSLRQAILDANSNNENDIINFDAAVFSTPQTILLVSGEIEIIPANITPQDNKTIAINGPGANLLTISGNNQNRIFYIDFTTVIVKGVTFRNGNGAGRILGTSGGAICTYGSGKLSLIDSVVTNNRARFGGGLYGSIDLLNSTVSHNTSSFKGGGIHLRGPSKIVNSTISRNTVAGNGGAVYVEATLADFVNSTVAFNQAFGLFIGGGYIGVFAGGIYDDGESGGEVTLLNTLVSNNSADFAPDFHGGIKSLGKNIIGNSTGNFIYGPGTGDRRDVDPQLDPVLRNNGGVVKTHALRINSPAIDTGSNCVLNSIGNGGCLEFVISIDSRGVSRPQDADANGDAIVDIGAFELLRSEVLLAPQMPDLQAASDSGASDTDNITKNRNLSFTVNSLTNGAVVELFRDDMVVGSASVAGDSITFVDESLPANGTFQYTARQIVGGNASVPTSALSVTVDTIAPTVIINQNTAQSDPTNALPIGYFIVFSEPVTGFDTADVSLAGSTADVSAATVNTLGETAYYGALVSNITGQGVVRASVIADAALDAAGNTSVVSISTDNAVIFDAVKPAVTVNQAASQVDPTRSGSVVFTVIFSESVTGFTNADVSLTGSTANVAGAFVSVSGNGATYSVTVSNFWSNGGFVRASVVANGAQDAAGNSNLASTSTDNTVTVDNVAPTVTINQAADQVDPATPLPIKFTVAFSEPITGFDAADVTLAGSSANTSRAVVAVSGSGSVYTVTVSNLISAGQVRARIFAGAAADAVGNPNASSLSTDNMVTYAPAFVGIGGRITNATGRFISDAQLLLTLPSGEQRYARVNPFGYYRFANIQTSNVTIAVTSKRSQAFSTTVFINGEQSDLNLILP